MRKNSVATIENLANIPDEFSHLELFYFPTQGFSFTIDQLEDLISVCYRYNIEIAVKCWAGVIKPNVVHTRIGNQNMYFSQETTELMLSDVEPGTIIPVLDRAYNSWNEKNTGLLIEPKQDNILLIGDGENQYQQKQDGVVVTEEIKNLFGSTYFEIYRKINSLYVSIDKQSADELQQYFNIELDNDRSQKYTAFVTNQPRSFRDHSVILKVDKEYKGNRPFLVVEPSTGSPFNTKTSLVTFILTEGKNEPTEVYGIKCFTTSGKNVTYSVQSEQTLMENQKVVKYYELPNFSGTGRHWNRTHLLIYKQNDIPDVAVIGGKATTGSRSGNTNVYQWNKKILGTIAQDGPNQLP